MRGELVIRAMHHKHALEDPTKRAALPFDEVVLCNIGNPQELQQKPVTFIRQVLSLLEYPELMNKPETQTLFPGDVIKRAKEILRHVPGGLGLCLCYHPFSLWDYNSHQRQVPIVAVWE